MRDNQWLEKQLQFLLSKYFGNVARTNPLAIRFGREAKFRFGSIKIEKSIKGTKSIKSIKGFFKKDRGDQGAHDGLGARPARSIITITSLFARERVPAAVVQYTIAHELCHYAHGFSSANRRLFKYPHLGGIVNRELADRGAARLTVAFKKWLKNYRKQILAGRAGVD